MAATSKILRNRIVGLLIILSVVLILVPAMMSPDDIYKKSPDVIAVNKDGVADRQQGSTTNYNDLLAPEDDLPSRQNPTEIARQNSQTPAGDAAQSLPLADNPEMDLPPEDGNPFLDSPAAKPASPDYLGDTRKNLANEDAVPRKESQSDDPMGAFVRNLEQKPVAQNSSKPTTKPAVKPQSTSKPAPKTEVSSTKGFVVQVGVFSKQENAQNVIAKLKKGGVNARQESAVLNGKNVFRVYAGTPGSRQNAENIAAKVKSITGSDGRVVNLSN